jgi:hypothetical protein
MPAPRKPSPSSPATSRTPAGGPGAHGPQPGGGGPSLTNPAPAAARPEDRRATAVTRAEALRWWRAGYQAGRQAAEHEHQARWDRLIASYHAQRAADQQAELDALLLEAIAALAGLFSGPDHPGSHPA